MRTRLAFLFVVVAASILGATRSDAAQAPNGRGQVVHTRRAPVILHKAVPPYRGVHVYAGNAR